MKIHYPGSFCYCWKGDYFPLISSRISCICSWHHQIRCQLAKIGCPIKGDLKYGFPRSNEGGGINLHARSITFKHPVSQEMITITAKPPLNDPLWKVFYEGMKE